MITDKDTSEFTRIVDNAYQAKTSELKAVFVSAVLGGAVNKILGLSDNDIIEGTPYKRQEVIARLSEAIDRRFPVPG